MERLFKKNHTSGVRADQVKRLCSLLAHLDDAQQPTDLDLPGYRLHALKGDLKGHWSDHFRQLADYLPLREW